MTQCKWVQKDAKTEGWWNCQKAEHDAGQAGHERPPNGALGAGPWLERVPPTLLPEAIPLEIEMDLSQPPMHPSEAPYGLQTPSPVPSEELQP